MKSEDVQIENEIRYEVPIHQTLLGFNSDIQSVIFEVWWSSIGKEDFVAFFNDYTKRNFR